ncbi:MAG TPA: hypothetical protein VFM18_17210 [Methanosarcina sp.]|nr:hypothetical protein [Methanosarcina sp.]
MINTIADETKRLWLSGRKVKTNASSGWMSGNAPCCAHNGETVDKRGRGGIMMNSNGSVSYHCFNCHFKASYVPGRHLPYKFRKLLSWLGADEGLIKRLVIDAIRIKELVAPESIKEEHHEEIVFKARPLPDEAKNILDLVTFYLDKSPPDLYNAVEYLALRKADTVKYKFYWTPETQYNLNKRVIVPLTWKNEIIGYTARATKDKISPKYHASIEPNYVFNVDKQLTDSKFVIVVEGPFDAMAIDGVAILGNECSEIQADIIDSLGREVILVPDADKSGSSLIDNAIEYGWNVSFPVWFETCKDVSKAVEMYGKLFVLKSILEAKETNKLKIELRKRRLYN